MFWVYFLGSMYYFLIYTVCGYFLNLYTLHMFFNFPVDLFILNWLNKANIKAPIPNVFLFTKNKLEAKV